jgi:hypothetical protein
MPPARGNHPWTSLRKSARVPKFGVRTAPSRRTEVRRLIRLITLRMREMFSHATRARQLYTRDAGLRTGVSITSTPAAEKGTGNPFDQLSAAGGPAVGQDFVELLNRARPDAREHIFEPRKRIDLCEFARRNEAAQ